MVKLIIQNYIGGDNAKPGNITFDDVSEDTTISQIKLDIWKSVEKTNGDVPSQETINDMYVLYMGTILLEDDETLGNNNQSNLNQITLGLYSKNVIKVKVAVMPCIKCCGIFYTPIVSKLGAQRLEIQIIDQETVLVLKRQILQELADYSNSRGEPLDLQNMTLLHKRFILDDNGTVLRELKGKVLKMSCFIPFGFKCKPKPRVEVSQLEA